MSITCQVCGTANPDGTTYCEGCGVELTGSAAPAEATSTEAPTSTEAAFTEAAPSEVAAEAAPARAPLTPPESLAGSAPVSIPATLTPDSSTATPLPTEGVGAAPASEVGEVMVSGAVVNGAVVNDTAMNNAVVSEEVGTEAAAPTPAVAVAPASAGPAATGEASLGIKKFGAPTGESIPLQGERLVVGRFDASSGPVDIDLSGLGGQEHVSRRHAELYREGGVWHVRDLGSTNGVYLKRRGESAFSPRLQEPATLSDGDEVAFGNLMFTFQQG